jgi:transcriptional regulator with XRE-family HTH domain
VNPEKKFLVDFGQKMAAARKKKGFTQEKLADVVGLHRTYIGFIEQGKRNPSIGNIYKIAKPLGISLKELFKEF